MIIVDNIKQGTEEWFALKLGIPSASKFSDICTPSTGEYSKSADRYMKDLMEEIVSGKRRETFQSTAMKNGTEIEPDARNWYAVTVDQEVREVAFIFRDERRDVGCSPDGLVIVDGVPVKGLEIKSVTFSTMVDIMESGKVPTEHIPQIQGGMFCTGLKEWDLLIYNENFGENQFLRTIKRDDAYISKLEMNIARFLREMQSRLAKLKLTRRAV